MRKIFAQIFVFTASIFIHLVGHANNSFNAVGSDLLYGIGAKGVSLSGAVSASSDDVYAIYWNPALLVSNQKISFGISRQLINSIDHINFIGVSSGAIKLPGNWGKFALGAGWVARLHVIGKGNFGDDQLENLFLQFALPAIPPAFDGEINSKTRDYRLSLAYSPAQFDKLKLGANFQWIRCVTNFCGVNASDGDYTVASTLATAFAINLGTSFEVNSRLRIAVVVKDLHTTLNVETTTTVEGNTQTQDFDTYFPTDITTGLRWKFSRDLSLSSDLEILRGRYGQHAIGFYLLRSGLSYTQGYFQYNLGTLIPLKMNTDNIEDLRTNMPFPFSGSAGVIWDWKYLSIGLAVYPHAIMSFRNDKMIPSLELSLSTSL